MQNPNISTQHLELFRNLLQQHIGFNFPAGLEKEFNFRIERALYNQGLNLGYVTDQLAKAQSNQDAVREITPLLAELLIGETYFWREPDTFAALATHIVPEIIKRKESYSRLLRVWSAACSTGEEIYTISFELNQLLKNTDWTVSLMGSDINEVALQIARRAEYGSYSFRSEQKISNYFEPTVRSLIWRVKEQYRNNVRFQKINLAGNNYPSVSNDTTNYDLIFCRNIFIYFKPELIEQVIERLYQSLNEGGYLIVSPCEYSMGFFKKFETVQVAGVTFYRRPSFYATANISSQPVPISVSNDVKYEIASLPEIDAPKSVVTSITAKAAVPSAEPKLIRAVSQNNAAQLFQIAKEAIANNQFEQAMDLCLQVMAKDALLANNYLCLANLYQRQGQLEEALEMARKFGYLEPNRIEGQYFMATLQHTLGRSKRAAQACRRVLNLLETAPVQTSFEFLPNLTTANLQQICQEILATIEQNSN